MYGKGEQPGKQDVAKGGERKVGAEIGPASRTGVKQKVRQNEALKKPGNVILFRQRGKPAGAGEKVEAVELTREQARRLAEEIDKHPDWSSKDIYKRAKEMAGGKSRFYTVSKEAAAYKGQPTHMRGKRINGGAPDTASKGTGSGGAHADAKAHAKAKVTSRVAGGVKGAVITYIISRALGNDAEASAQDALDFDPVLNDIGGNTLGNDSDIMGRSPAQIEHDEAIGRLLDERGDEFRRATRENWDERERMIAAMKEQIR